ncbi:MAG: 4Fe-4S binding protein, partial [Actinobacteria bacterium]|nr:4Fe-4S binding protein [Actinomycetota bacterium]
MPIKKFFSLKTFERSRIFLQVIFLISFSIILVFSIINDYYLKLIRLLLNADPLFYLSQSLANLKLSTGLSIAVFFVLFSLLLGRFWCGWLCPLGTILDLFPRRKRKVSSRLNWLLSLKHLFWSSILFLSLFGFQTLLVLDPLTIFIRTFAVILWPIIYYFLKFTEWLAYRVPSLGEYWSNLSYSIGLTNVLDKTPNYNHLLSILFLFLIIIILNSVAERFWCRYLCPLGGLLSLISKFSIFRLSSSKRCVSCSNCVDVCPTDALSIKDGLNLDFSECIFCLRCLNACRRNDIKLTSFLRKWKEVEFAPEKRAFLASAFTSFFLYSLLRINPNVKKKDLLRPPGATENSLNLKCVRCGACIKACPTGAIQPSFLEGGLQSFWTPRVVPRIGYCDYNCNRCGKVCPYGAIPNLKLGTKQKTSLGKAVINKKICLPWSQGKPCLVCEEACPVPNKAIELEEKIVT